MMPSQAGREVLFHQQPVVQPFFQLLIVLLASSPTTYFPELKFLFHGIPHDCAFIAVLLLLSGGNSSRLSSTNVIGQQPEFLIMHQYNPTSLWNNQVQ